MSANAYVTFIIRNDSYLPGALVFAYALRLQRTTHDLVCLVSKEVSDNAQAALRTLYDHVLVIDEVYVPHERRHERQDRPFLFTRFHAFRLGQDGDLGLAYDKIVVADCDVLPLRDYDTLFNVPAPAGIINEKKEYCMQYEDGLYIIPDSVAIDGTWNWHWVYADVPHGTLIPKHITDRIHEDKTNMGINASIFVFEPSMIQFHSIMADVEDATVQREVATYNWPEMQYITTKLSGRWHNVDLRYSSFNGYPHVDVLFGIHFAGLKPWSIQNKSVSSFAKFADYKLWHHTFLRMMKDHPALRDIGKLRRIEEYLQGLQEKPKYRINPKEYPLLPHFFQ